MLQLLRCSRSLWCAALLVVWLSLPVSAQTLSLVNQSHPAATDDNNPLGTWSTPRRTIPNPAHAGLTVELLGRYDEPHTSPRTLRLNGTASQPVVIRGFVHLPAVLTQDWEVIGDHFTIERVQSSRVISVLAPSSHFNLTFNEFAGTPTQRAGLTLASYQPAAEQPKAWYRDGLIYGNYIHDSGDLKATFDQDFHGISLGAWGERIRIEHNVLMRNSGDGVQINGGAKGHAILRDILVLENIAKDNKQTGFWAKQSTDVRFVRNLVSGARPGQYTVGACIGGQYDPEHLWVVDNDLSDCEYGVFLAGDSNGDGKYRFVIGNRIRNIHPQSGVLLPGNLRQSAAISVWAGGINYVLGNTISDVSYGIGKAEGASKVYDAANTFTAVKGAARLGEITGVVDANLPFIRDYYTARYGAGK